MFMKLLPLLVFFWLLPGQAYSQQAEVPERTELERNDFVCLNEDSSADAYFAEPSKLIMRVAEGVSPEKEHMGCCACGPRGCRANQPPHCKCCMCHVRDICFKAFDAKEGTATFTKDGKTHQLPVTKESFDLFKGLNPDDCGRLDVSPELKATGFEHGK